MARKIRALRRPIQRSFDCALRASLRMTSNLEFWGGSFGSGLFSLLSHLIEQRTLAGDAVSDNNRQRGDNSRQRWRG
jgi:hypothetical protein